MTNFHIKTVQKLSETSDSNLTGQLKWAFRILDIVDDDGVSLGSGVTNIFLYHKPEGVSGVVQLYNADYLGLVPVGCFGQADKPKIGNYLPTEWENIPLVAKSDEGIIPDSIYIPADVDIRLTEDRQVVSDSFVFVGLPFAITGVKEQLLASLTDFINYYATAASVSTTFNTTGNGWEGIVI